MRKLSAAEQKTSELVFFGSVMLDGSVFYLTAVLVNATEIQMITDKLHEKEKMREMSLRTALLDENYGIASLLCDLLFKY